LVAGFVGISDLCFESEGVYVLLGFGGCAEEDGVAGGPAFVEEPADPSGNLCDPLGGRYFVSGGGWLTLAPGVGESCTEEVVPADAFLSFQRSVHVVVFDLLKVVVVGLIDVVHPVVNAGYNVIRELVVWMCGGVEYGVDFGDGKGLEWGIVGPSTL
jgi:hypothetical protein